MKVVIFLTDKSKYFQGYEIIDHYPFALRVGLE